MSAARADSDLVQVCANAASFLFEIRSLVSHLRSSSTLPPRALVSFGHFPDIMAEGFPQSDHFEIVSMWHPFSVLKRASLLVWRLFI